MPPSPRLALFARYPEPGLAKTRLIPALGADGAARVHRRLTERTLDILAQSSLPVELHFTGAPASAFREWLGDGITLIEQPEGDLTARLLAALEPAPVIFFGADTPGLEPAHVSAAVSALEDNDVVIGPAADGGYYLIGVRSPFAYLFETMPWSTDAVTPETLRRATAAGLSHALLETLHDCDRPEDVPAWLLA